MKERILKKLHDIEREDHVLVLYACEAGSRAWGFPSQDSDYDVRFLYVHPTDWYLCIDLERKRDVIERPIDDELDLSGWDLRKALGLFRRSNPPLWEWLKSPIIYLEKSDVAERLRELAPAFYSPVSYYHYYRNQARRVRRIHRRCSSSVPGPGCCK
jgi:predicted nucleotidyltransferase